MIEFSTYIIRYKDNPDKTVQGVYILVLGCVIAIIIAAALGYNTTATGLFIFTLIIILIVAIAKKGKINPGVLTNEKLVITSSTVSIGGKDYIIKEIKELRFHIHSYAGAQYTNRGVKTSDGMDNSISFTYDNKEVKCRFYLNSAKHTYILCQLFDEFYRGKIPFIETDRAGYQTYLFKRLDEKELAAFKEKYGYK